MGGIIGVVDKGMGKSTLQALLQRMCRSLTYEDWYQTFLYMNDSVALGRVSLGVINSEPQPIFDEDEMLCILMEGEIYNADDLRRQFALPSSISPSANDPQLLLHLYKVHGLDFVPEINGSFALAIWDSSQHKLIIINDRYGLRPIYYAQMRDRLLFAPEVKAILQDPKVERTVDNEAVADFLAFQLVFGDKTLFANVRVLPPASILTYYEGKLSLEKYWDFGFQGEKERLSEDFYVERLSYLVRQAVERQMQGDQDVGLFLSGGLDSRMLLGFIDRKYFPVHTFTQGIEKCNDVRFARKVAECVGSSHHYIPFEPTFLPSFAERGVWLTDGMMSCEHMSRLNLLSFARRHTPIAFDGLGGDGIIGGLYLTQEYFDRDFSEEEFVDFLYWRFVAAFSDRLQPRLCTDSYLPKISGAAYNSVKEAVSSSPEVNVANRSEYIYLKNRQRRYIFFGPIMTRSQLECRTPFYDNDLVDFSYTIPPELKLDKNLHLRILRETLPDLAHIPYAFSGIPVTSSKPLRLFIRRGIYRAQRELRDWTYRLTSGRLILPYYREYKDTSYWLRTHLRDWAKDILLSKRANERGYFNTAYIRQLLDEHISGKYDHRSRICTLLTFELWHRLFID